MPTIAVFDLGNVLLDWSPAFLYAKLFPARPDAMAWFLDNICTPAWNLEQDGGRDWATGVGALASLYPEWRSEIEAFDRRWHEMIPDVIHGTVAVLDTLRAAGVPLFAVTNFSSEKYAESVRRFPFLGWFDGVIVSGDERLLKPDAPIFALLCARYKVSPGDCVFIDDKAENVAGAQAFGMIGHRFTSAEELADDLRRLGLLPTLEREAR